LGRGTTPLPIVYFVPFHEDYIQMLLFLKTPKWESQDWKSQPHFEGSVKSSLTLPKMGLGSPWGLPKLQSSIAGAKTPCIRVFFIPLESSWSVDVQNGLTWAIWTSASQVIVERRAGNQTSSLTPDHKKLRIDPIPVCVGGVRHTVGKLSTSAIGLFQTSSELKVGARSYECPKSRESKPGHFRDYTLGVPGKSAIRMQVQRWDAENTIWGKVVASPEFGSWWVKWVQGYPWLVLAPRVLQNMN